MNDKSFQSGGIVSGGSNSDVAHIQAGEIMMSYDQFLNMGILMGQSIDQIDKEWDEAEKVNLKDL